MSSNEVQILEQIDARLKQLVVLTAAAHISGLKQGNAIETLGHLGFSAKEISEVTGYPNSSVAPTLSKMKKVKKK